MSSPYQPVPALTPADLEPTLSNPIVGRYAQDLVAALQKAASLGLGVPAAMTRITRTPVFEGGEGWPATKGGQYDPNTGAITVLPEGMQPFYRILPHESAHAIYDQAGLSQITPQLFGPTMPHLPPAAVNQIQIHPELYPIIGTRSSSGMPSFKQDREILSNEGLAFSIGDPAGTPFVEAIANKIKDPALAAELLRLHHNALGTRKAAELQALQELKWGGRP
jgi:hypothetical protein